MKLLAIAIICLFSSPIFAQTSVEVNSLADNMEEDGLTTFREAILAANESETIKLITFSKETFSSPDSVIVLKERLPDLNKTGFSIQGLMPAIRITRHPESSFIDTVLKVSGNDITLAYLSFEEFTSGTVYTVLGMENISDLTITGLHFKNCNQAAAFTGQAESIHFLQLSLVECYTGVVFNDSVNDFSVSSSYSDGMYGDIFNFNGPASLVSFTNNQFNYDDSDDERIVQNPPVDETRRINPVENARPEKKNNPTLSPEQLKIKESLRPQRKLFPNPAPEVYNSGYGIYFTNTVSQILVKNNHFNGIDYPIRIIGEEPSKSLNAATSGVVEVIGNRIDNAYNFFEVASVNTVKFSENIVAGDYTYYNYFFSAYHCSNILIEKNVFGFDSYPTYYPIYVESSTNLTVTDNNFSYAGNAIYLSEVEGFVANENLFGFIDDEAIEMYEVSYIQIFDNLFEYTEDEAIYMSNCFNADIFHNSFEFMEDGTLYAYESEDITFRENQVNYADDGGFGYFYYTNTILVEENAMNFISCQPVYLENCTDVTVRKHRFSVGYCEFITAYYSDNVLIEENWFSKSEDEFIYSYESDRIRIKNNIFQENYYSNAIYFYNYNYNPESGSIESSDSDTIWVTENIFSQIAYSPIYIYHEYDTIRYEVYEINQNIFDRYGINGGGDGVQSVQYQSPAIQVYNYGKEDSYNIMANRFEKGGSPVYMHGNFSSVNFNFNNMMQIKGNGFQYYPYEDPIVIDATANFWDSPFGPNDPDSLEGDTLKLFNDNPEGLWVTSWVNWQEYLSEPVDLGGNPLLVREISHPVISHKDSSGVLLRGFDFSRVTSVFLGPVEAIIDGKTSSLLGLIFVNPLPGYHPLILHSDDRVDTVHKAIYVMNEVPPPPIMIGPGPDAQGVSSQPVFSWNPVADPDGDQVEYILAINKGEPGTLTGEVSFRFKTSETTFKTPEHLDLDATYFWTVTAQDEFGWYAEKANWLSFTPVVFSSVDENPVQYELAQNYPNPFNPSTTIRFGLVQPQHVKLAVYDATGRLVQVLVNGMRPAGYSTVEFKGDGLSSGLYFYKLEAGPLKEIRKMMLVK